MLGREPLTCFPLFAFPVSVSSGLVPGHSFIFVYASCSLISWIPAFPVSAVSFLSLLISVPLYLLAQVCQTRDRRAALNEACGPLATSLTCLSSCPVVGRPPGVFPDGGL